MSQEAKAIELGFFQALAHSGIPLKVAASLYDDVVQTLIKSAMVRYRTTPYRQRVPGVNDETGMKDILGVPGFSAPPRKPAAAAPASTTRSSTETMQDTLRPPPLLSRAANTIRDYTSSALKTLGKHPIRAGTGATAAGITGAAAGGTGTGILGNSVLKALRQR